MLRVVQQRLLILVMIAVLPLLVTGCFRQASEPFVESPIGPLATLTAESSLSQPAMFTPTVAPLVLLTETPAFIAPVEPSQTGLALTDPPATVTSPTNAQPSDITPTPTLPILLATNTRGIVTPAPPAGPVDFSTPTPFGGIGATPTPLDLLITPTDFFNGGGQCAYIIQPGDSLYQIAINNDTTVDALRQANPQLSGDLIQPGEELTLPGCGAPVPTVTNDSTAPTAESTAASGERIHIVRAGDTLFGIAREYGVTVQSIIDANNLTNPDRLDLGQELIIP